MFLVITTFTPKISMSPLEAAWLALAMIVVDTEFLKII